MTNQIEAITSFVVAGLSALSIPLAQLTPGDFEQKIQAGGTAGLIIGLSTGLIFLWRDRAELVKALQASEKARIDDAKESLTQWREDAEKGEKSRAEMIRQLEIQTRAILEKK